MVWKWVLFGFLLFVAGCGVLVPFMYRLFVDARTLMRDITAAQGRLTEAGGALASGLEEMRPADDARPGGDGPELAGRVAAWRDSAGVRGR